MGLYINPGNEAFRNKLNGDYVDKSGLIRVINYTLDTERKLSCISRPRRFGKSTAAQMLCAYYDCSVDSSTLFDDLKISKDAGYREHLNKYNVLCLDISAFFARIKDQAELADKITETVINDINRQFPGVWDKSEDVLIDALEAVAETTGRKFIAIIDEWDAPVRDSYSTEKSQKLYLEFLRSLFKNAVATDKVFAAAYMTGILPIKKDGTQSAISEFREYSVLNPQKFAPYIGFTEDEVRSLCEKHDMSFEEMKNWYDGYSLGDVKSIYNSNSVMEAISRGKYASYWQQSAASDSLLSYINMGYAELGEIVPQLLLGKEIPVKTTRFKNDLTSFASADDVLTILIHFGYLSYDEENETVRIPNREILAEYEDIVRVIRYPSTMERVRESDELIRNTIAMNAEAVAAQIEKVHTLEYTPRFYNNEQSLRGVLKLAYFAYKEKYFQMEEVPGGTGYADLIFIPRKGLQLPALVVELKWDKDADTAIKQIKERRYADTIRDWGGGILLVGISYDKDSADKKHSCVIEEWG